MLKKSRDTDQVISKINLLAVRFFRPDYPVAGIEDFTQNGRKLSCEMPGTLWATLLDAAKAEALLKCVNSLEEMAHYVYVPKTQPYLEVDALEKGPDLCIYQLMPSLPLPREVYFLGKAAEKETQEVYAMSFDTQANQVADIELRSPRFEVKFKFPLTRKLQTIQDLKLWLLTSVLSLFEEQGITKASVVPSLVANACFQDDPLFQDKRNDKIPGVFWP